MKKLILGIIVLFNTHFIQAQLVQEYEVDAGYSIFQGDYGVRGDFSSTLGNSGFLLNGKAYFDLLGYNKFGCYACKHVKFPLNFNVGYSILNFDKTNYSNASSEGIKINAFRGNIFQSSLSFGFEYHIGDLSKVSFGNTSLFDNIDPYFGAGIGGAVYVVKLKSDLGDYEVNPNILPSAFVGGIYDKPGIVPMLNIETGIRYKLSETLNISVNGKWLYYFSDKVDGLVPNSDLVDNLYNDWQFSPSIGFVFQLRNQGFFAR
jgi:hypothetical protein